MITDAIIQQIQSLLDVAGREWPELVQNDDECAGAAYECPMCGGEGSVPAGEVYEGSAIPGPKLTLCGVQVFGVGEQHVALSSLMPLVLDHLPEILAERARLRDALLLMLAQHACGCMHPACNRCAEDRICRAALGLPTPDQSAAQ